MSQQKTGPAGKTLAVAVVIGLLIGAVIGYGIAAATMVPYSKYAELEKKLEQLQAGAAAPEYTFYYVSHGGPADPWWAPVIKGSQDAARLLNVKVVYSGPEKFSIQALVDLLNSAIAAKPQGIILTITDYKALDEPARRAIAQGIPIIAVNVPDPRPPNERIPYLSYVGQNEYDAGYYLAKYLVDKGYKPKRVVIGIHEVGHIGLETRAKGITDAITQAYPGTPVEKLDITTDPTKAAEVFKSYLTAHPDTDVIFTLGPLGAHPALQVLREMKLTGKVHLLTVDIDNVILKAIEAGELDAAVSQQPYAQGFLPVVFMYLYVKYGIIPPPQVPTGPTVIDKAKLETVKKQIATTGGA
ncbi:sugar ABC transporter substrate-binding protein [Thermofilum pendens]|nr:sugar ABC transporter substrate-binding protein [Thermofilum pendens]